MCILASTVAALRPKRSASRAAIIFRPATRRETNAYGGRGFHCVARKVWNSLPADIRQGDVSNDFQTEIRLFIP